MLWLVVNPVTGIKSYINQPLEIIIDYDLLRIGITSQMTIVHVNEEYCDRSTEQQHVGSGCRSRRPANQLAGGRSVRQRHHRHLHVPQPQQQEAQALRGQRAGQARNRWLFMKQFYTRSMLIHRVKGWTNSTRNVATKSQSVSNQPQKSHFDTHHLRFWWNLSWLFHSLMQVTIPIFFALSPV